MKEEWIDILLKAVYEASAEIMKVYSTPFEVIRKADHSPVTQADKNSSTILHRYISPLGYPIVSEEEVKPPYEERKDAELLWLIDPLDGTKEFVKKNDEFCICIALIQNQAPIFGMIASPVEQEVIFGGKDMGAYKIPFFFFFIFDPKQKLELSIPEQKSLVYSRSHFSPEVSQIVNQIEDQYGKLEVIKKGSALKFFDLISGKAQFYPRLAPTMEWDIAAGQAIYEAIGGEVLDFSKFEPLRYNKEDLYNPYFIAKPKGLEIK